MTTKTRPGDPLCWNIIGTQGDKSCPELEKYVHCRSCPVFAAAGKALFERAAPDGYLQEWANVIAKPAAKVTKKKSSVVVFRLGREWLGIETRLFVEVAEMRKPRRIAHRSGRILSGIVNIRGQLELCVSLRSLLHVHPTGADEPRKRLLVVEREQERWVFDADEVHGVHRYSESDLGPVPATLNTPLRDGTGDAITTYTRAVLTLEDERRAAVLDSEALWNALRRGVE